MVPRKRQLGHAWVAGLDWLQHEGPQLQLLHPGRTGMATSQIPLVDASDLPAMDEGSPCYRKCRSEHRPFYCEDLSQAETLYEPTEIIRRLVPHVPKRSAHAVYRLPGERPTYVPALALIQALFMGTRILDRHLLIPNAPDLLGFAFRGKEGVEIHLHRPLNAPLASGRMVRLLAWMLLEPDGRVAHASVLEYLRRERIALRIPRISIGGWARGLVTDDDHFLAYELAQVDIRYPGLSGDIHVSVGRSHLVVPAYEPPPVSPWSRRYPGHELPDPLFEAIKSSST